MGDVSSPRLAAAVADAGALGMVGLTNAPLSYGEKALDVRRKIGLRAVLGQVLDSVRVPVVAAGGIGTGRAMAAVLAMGASAVRVGTRFAAAAESEAHPRYVQRLIAAEAKDTVLTEAFSTGWNAPHRVLRSSVEAAERFSGDVVCERIRRWAPDERVPVRRC